MKTYRATQRVREGTYLNVSEWNTVHVAEGGDLPGGEPAHYVRVPEAMILVLGPLIGLAYVIAMPIAALAAIAYLIVGKVLGGLMAGVGRTMTFGWRPATSYLAGRKGRKEKKDTAEKPEKSDETSRR